MSQENLEIVRESVRRWVSGDLSGFAELCAPDVVSVAAPDWPEGGRFEGRDAVMRQLTRVHEDWGHQTMEIQKESAERDWVVMEVLWTAEGAGSGVSGQATLTGAFRVDGPLIAELLFFWKWDDALEAAGLRE